MKQIETLTSTDRNYTIQSVHHTLQVLETFLDVDGAAQRITEIGERLGMNKSRVFRILNTLEQHGFIDQDPNTRQYRLGLRLMSLGEAVRRQLGIVQMADPVLDELAGQSGETVNLVVVDGREAVCVAERESKHSVRLYGEVGRRAPLHVGGAPKVLLAYMPPEERARIIGGRALPRVTESTVTDAGQLEEILAQIRRDGYTVTVGDLDHGAHSIAAPVRDHTGCVVAALSVAGPSHRFSPEKIQCFIQLVCRAAARISSCLGYDPPQPENTK